MIGEFSMSYSVLKLRENIGSQGNVALKLKNRRKYRDIVLTDYPTL